MSKANIEPPKEKVGKGTPPTEPSKNLDKPASGKNVALHFTVPVEFRKRYKAYANENDMSMLELLMRSFELYQKNR